MDNLPASALILYTLLFWVQNRLIPTLLAKLTYDSLPGLRDAEYR
jgi:hypothetical protein